MVTAAASRPATTRTAGYLFRKVRDRSFVADPRFRPRLGTTANVDSVWLMHDGFFEDRDEIERYAADDRLFLYETPADELVGCGILTRVIADYDAVDVGMVVAEAHRRRGIGAYIVAHLKHHCLTSGDRPICGCSADNQSSRRTLESAGFVTAHSLVPTAPCPGVTAMRAARHRVNVRWVTPLGVVTASTWYFCSKASRPSHSRTPRPSRIGTCTTCRWSTRPAARNARTRPAGQETGER